MGILQFSLIALALFYILITIYAMIRLYKILSRKNIIKISIAFYSGMVIASVSRAVTLYLININMITPEQQDEIGKTALNIFIYLMIVIPDMLNVCVYLFLAWYFYAHFILSHINLANDLSLFLKNDTPTIKNKTYVLLYTVLPTYVLVFSIICILSFTTAINNDTLYKTNAYFNAITPVLLLAYYIFLLIKFSGRPYINDKLKFQNRKIFLIVIVWSLARIVTGILGLASGGFFRSIIIDFNINSENVAYSVKILVYFIISEFIPDLFALDYSLMMTYLKQDEVIDDNTSSESIDLKENDNGMKTISSNSPDSHNNNIAINIGGGSTSQNINKRKKTLTDIMIKFSDINFLETIYHKKNGLGTIYKAMYLNKEVMCRVIKFDRLSRYDLEGISKDMEEIMY